MMGFVRKPESGTYTTEAFLSVRSLPGDMGILLKLHFIGSQYRPSTTHP